MPVIIEAREKFEELVAENNLSTENIKITAEGLDPEEAIGHPERQDFPLLQGEEVMIEAKFKNSRGQAFTDQPGEYEGTLEEILSFDLDSSYRRALLVAAINVVLRDLDLIEKTVHCRDDDMEDCAEEIMAWIKTNHGELQTIGLIGFQPAFLEAAAKTFGSNNILVTDLNQDRIGGSDYGIEVRNGEKFNRRLIKKSGFVLVTGSTMINGSAGKLLELFAEQNKDFAFYGNTITGLAYLMDLPQLCFYGRRG
ncbi:Rossmann-like domain-containing protein [Halarsenatibacter silvermanii]|uniref:Putative heavy-metal chelation n=1 Tax=Halarsenatibacter silvermanii TaxID=321763 RepID=A0A1G9KZ03_9FIRM|nr:DUF364 domain-containing protein [Halarsenatibacter silvermanii]SDL54687.1 Putative heavy-metal chelation [Halarsenatibacter silvermanii]